MRARTSIRLLPLGILIAVFLAAMVVAPRLIPHADDAAAQEPLTVSLDMDTTDGGPCAEIDSSVSHDTGDSYDVAVCVTGLYSTPDLEIGSFIFDVIYDDTLNRAPEVADVGKALDDNPDANAGVTTWGDGLGTGWDCSTDGLAYPRGDRDLASGAGHGAAFIACDSIAGPWTLGDDETSGVIAVISFVANYGGIDTLTIDNSGYLAYPDTSLMGQCDPAWGFPMDCNGGTDNKNGTPPPTATPTATATPTPWCGGSGQPPCPTSTPTRPPWPTATRTPTPPPGVGGRVRLPPAAIAAEASRAADGPGSSTANGIVWAGAAAGGVLLLATGGWYARRRYGR